jgi:hypothetical protein
MFAEWASLPDRDGKAPIPVTARRETKASGERAIIVGQLDEDGSGSYRELCDAFDGVVRLLERRLMSSSPPG